MGPLIESFWQHLIQNNKKPATIRAYLQNIKDMAAWLELTTGEPFILANITPIDLAEYKRYLMHQQRPATINRAVAAVKVFYAWAAVEGLAPEGIAKGLRRLPEGRKSPKWLDRKEQLRLVRALQRDGTKRDIALIGLMLYGGLRVEEAVKVLTQDLEVGERKARVIVRQGKGDKWREVPINNDARKAILPHIENHPGGKWLFPSIRRAGHHITTRAAWQVLHKYATLAQVEVSPHRLRHTFCHNLVKAGVPLDQVAILAGHITNDGLPNVKTTVIYTQPGEADLRAAVDSISWEV